MFNFSNEQIERYSRHIILKEVGGMGQTRLLESKVLLIGAGGLGSPIGMYLAAAGVGTLGIIDDDVVDLSNLQRQILHGVNDIGVLKTQVRRRHYRRDEPGCQGDSPQRAHHLGKRFPDIWNSMI